MSHKTEYFEIIDKYLNNELTELEISELKLEMTFNSALVDEYHLQLDIQEAILEKDIVNLRETMHKITSQLDLPSDGQQPPATHSGSFNFELAEELTSPNQNFNGQIKMEDIARFTDSFPKIHLYQHLMAAKENIYQFYKEQHEQTDKKDKDSFSPMDDALFDEIKMAMQENDIMDLRANLKQIASRVRNHSHSLSEIHDFVDQTMNQEQRIQFEEKINNDKALLADVQLFKEIDMAIGEDDIMQLRASLKAIQKSAPGISTGIEKIEGYLNDELTEDEMDLFESELIKNKNLTQEVDLVKHINFALQEKEIMQLRNTLREIAKAQEKENQNERSITGRVKSRKIAISAVAASLILAMGVTGLLRYTADDNIYQNFHSPYETAGISRSSNSSSDQTFAMALEKYNSKDYQSALDLLQEVIAKDQNNTASHFYSGVSLQELGKYKNAIEEYQIVVIDKDNLFIEQAEWYIGLCLIQTKEDQKAIEQFRKIAKGKGFYQLKAEAILRKMKEEI